LNATLFVASHDSSNNKQIAELLDSWFPIDDIVLQQLRDQLQVVRLPARRDVFRRGDGCRSYLVVVEGSVRVHTVSATGREVVLYRVTDGQSCVITTACLMSGEAYPAEAVTETETSALVIPHTVFGRMLGHSAAFQRFVFASHGKRLGDLIQRINEVTSGRVDTRLARLLLDRSKSGGDAVTATHQQLASELGTAREVVSRQLKAFEKHGWIRVLRGSVQVLQPQALRRLGRDTG
jgi:CRP/FNR family transcriptional regulator